MIALDTNILIYTVDLTDNVKRATASAVLRRALASGEVAVGDQSLFEFAYVTQRKKLIPRTEALELVGRWADALKVILPRAGIVPETLDLLQKFNLSVWDARLLATCAANGVSTLFSEDMQDGGQYGPVRVLDPFNPANDRIVDELLK